MASSSSSSSFNEGNFEKRLINVNNTQECIQTLSLWCLHHKAQYKKIIDIWFKVFKKVKLNNRLALFYLANDVIQNSKRKGCTQFVEGWRTVLKRAAPYVRDEDVRNQIERIFVIWENRSVYDAAFIKELTHTIAGHTKTVTTSTVDTKILTEFKPQKLVDRIRKFKKVEVESDLKQKQFCGLKIDICSSETLKNLKDKSHGQKFTQDFEDATIKLEEYVESLNRDVKERAGLVEMLSQSEIYYDTQKKEVKIVGNAYKNFGSRVKNLKSKLEEFLPNLPSPIPSPSIDAPSPVDSSIEGSPRKSENKDNTEAVDMEMSDDENGKDGFKSDVQSPGSAPSPEGSPVGLSASPVKNKDKHSTNSSHKSSSSKKDKKPMGPTVASILAQISKSGPKPAQTKQSASSLDIRLSNLMQNIPNFTSNLFGGRANFNSAGESGGSGTPVKDEESGRGSVTPLLDESREAREYLSALDTDERSVNYDQNIFPSKDAPGGGGTPTLGDILQKLVNTGATLNLPSQSNTPNWESPIQSQQQQNWFNQNQVSNNAGCLSNVRQLNVTEYRPNANVFMDSAFEQTQLGNRGGGGGGQFHSSHNGDGNDPSSIERHGRPSSVGYRRNSNIVELTPSPTRNQTFDSHSETSANLVPLGGRNHNDNLIMRNDVERSFPIVQQLHRAGLVPAPTFPRRTLLGRTSENNSETDFTQDPNLHNLMENSSVNSNLRMIVPVGSFHGEDKEMIREQPRPFSKIETVGGGREEFQMEAGGNEQWETPTQSSGSQEQLYLQINPPQGWHSLGSPPPRREAPPYTGAYRGFRFPRRAATPRRMARDWNPLPTSPKRALLSPLRPRWAHNAGPPF